jgi:hypothetical protein
VYVCASLKKYRRMRRCVVESQVAKLTDPGLATSGFLGTGAGYARVCDVALCAAARAQLLRRNRSRGMI